MGLIVVLLLVAGGIFAAGGKIAAYVIGGLALLIGIGNLIGRFLPESIPQKYLDRL